MNFSMLPALQFEDPEPPKSHNGSCTYLKKTNISHFDVAISSCMEDALPICEWKFEAQWSSVNLNDLDNMESSSIIGAYLHPMNSQSSCLAFCGSKEETQSVFVQGSMCICSKGKYIYYHIIKLIVSTAVLPKKSSLPV